MELVVGVVLFVSGLLGFVFAGVVLFVSGLLLLVVVFPPHPMISSVVIKAMDRVFIFFCW